MARHPQLRVRETALADFSAAHFFDVTLRELLVTHRADARAIGGRYGFIIGSEQRVVDLDHGRIRGDAYGSVVHDDDALDAVVHMSDAAFADMLRGRPARDRSASEAYAGAFDGFVRFLAKVTR